MTMMNEGGKADEVIYWIELIVEASLMKAGLVSDLYREADEILAMTVASIKTGRKHK